VAGRLFVANLAVLASLVGTPLMPNLEGALLVVEDVNEPAFRVDRFLWQLMAGGALRGVVGLVAGAFTGVAERERAAIGMVLAEVGAALAVPVVSGLPVGHGEANACLPIGRLAWLREGRLEVSLDEVGGRGGIHASCA
jgi:muramoyltetrapeptide carboxypeptidase